MYHNHYGLAKGVIKKKEETPGIETHFYPTRQSFIMQIYLVNVACTLTP